MSPFEYINSITYKKDLVMDTPLKESLYNPFLTNKSLSQFIDCALLANEMNMRHQADHKLQYDYLINKVRPRKRFKKWDKKIDNDDLEIVKEYYEYSNEKAKSALPLLSKQQLEIIRNKITKGGVK